MRVRSAKQRVLADTRAGTLAPAVMIAMLHYYGGKPKDTVEVTGSGGGSPRAEVLYLPRNGREVIEVPPKALTAGRSDQN